MSSNTARFRRRVLEILEDSHVPRLENRTVNSECRRGERRSGNSNSSDELVAENSTPNWTPIAAYYDAPRSDTSSSTTYWGGTPASTNSLAKSHLGLADPFCDCIKVKGREYSCRCGEEDTVFEWIWDKDAKSAATQLSNDSREVKFHQEFSCGTAAVRGSQPMKNRQYYWEVKMTTPVYGTDMMVGVGTAAANLNKNRYNFCSLLGSDCESWGLSYTGTIHHQGKSQSYAPKFGQGSIIGVHLDTWNGTLTFFKNRQSLGIAYKNLHGKTLYPMVSSTAARSGMKIVKSRSVDSSLQYLCIQALRGKIPPNIALIDAMNFPPGLRTFLENNLDWLACSALTSANKSDLSKQGLKRRHSGSDEEDVLLTCKRRCYMQ